MINKLNFDQQKARKTVNYRSTFWKDYREDYKLKKQRRIKKTRSQKSKTPLFINKINNLNQLYYFQVLKKKKEYKIINPK